MSTQGSGTAALVLFAPLGLAVGAGILAGRAIMWCGEQLELHYQTTCQKLAEAEAAARNYSNAQREQIQSVFYAIMKSHALKNASRQQERTNEEQQAQEAEQQAMRDALAQAHAILTDSSYVSGSNRSADSLQDIERASLLLQLDVMIDYTRPLLDASFIIRAERARNGSLSDMRSAIDMLEEESSRIESIETQQERLRGQLRHALRLVKTQAHALDEMLLDVQKTPELLSQQHRLTSLMEAAANNLDSDLDAAQPLVVEAEQVVQRFTDNVSKVLYNAWDSLHRQVSEQLGTLTTLKGMIEDARVAEMAPSSALETLTHQLTSAYNEANEIAQSSSLQVAPRLSLLATRTAFLKEDVFALVENYQQHKIADTIATTLNQCGFESASGDAPQVQTYGDTMRVTAMRNEQTRNGMRDDKLVTFEVSRQGNVHYDFSGYTDAGCVEEAEKIFEELRIAGIYLFDQQQARTLQETYPEGVPLNILNRSRYQLHPEADKLQMELAQRLHSVLEQMHYTHIQQSSVGGCIELDAFNGTLGYHVVLTPEGDARILKNGEELDPAHDTFDSLVEQAQQVIAEKSEQQAAEVEQELHEQKSTRKQQSSRRTQARKHMLES